MTYRYLGSRSTVGPDGEIEGAMAIRRDMRNPAGGPWPRPSPSPSPTLRAWSVDAISVPAPVDQLGARARSRLRRRRSASAAPPIHDGRTIGFGDRGDLRRRPAESDHRPHAGDGSEAAEAPPGYEYVDPGPAFPIRQPSSAPRGVRSAGVTTGVGDSAARRPHRVDVGLAAPRRHPGAAGSGGHGPRY